jgi:hypothetical protein
LGTLMIVTVIVLAVAHFLITRQRERRAALLPT